MPFYEYKCSNCGHELEELQSIKDAPLKKCPVCGKETLQKLMGTGAGLIFRGSGFYLTDYKKQTSTAGSDQGKPAKAESKSEPVNEKKADTKSGSKDTSKTASKSENSSGETKSSAGKKENKKS